MNDHKELNSTTIPENPIAIAIKTGEHFFNLFGGASSVYVSEANIVVASYESEHAKLGIKIGDTFTEGTTAHEAMVKNTRVVRQISKEKSKFGIPYVGMSIPILNTTGKVVGSIAITSPIVKQEILKETAKQLGDTSTQTIKASEEIAESAGKLAAAVGSLSQSSAKAQEELSTIGDVINLIKQISSHTRLLSLNATIEAARAGEAGRGFSVVANEVRKLAQDTNGNVEEISKKLLSISTAVGEIAEKITQIDSLSQNQAAVTEEISASMNSLDESAKKILTIADNLNT